MTSPTADREALWRRLRRRRVPALLIGVGLCVAAIGIITQQLDLFRRLELDTVDARFTVRGERAPRKDLVVVSIDAATFARLQRQWPFPRRIHGRVVDAIARDKPKAIAFDVQFTEPTNDRDDNALIDAVARAGDVVLSTTETDRGGGTAIFGGNDVLRQIGARPGSTNYRTDPGGVFRRAAYAIGGLESFGLVTAEVVRGRPIHPADLGGRTAFIDFAGPPGTIPSVSYGRVAQHRLPRGYFKDKIVVIGASVPSLQDVHATSTTGNGLMSGPEIQANLIATALAGFPLQPAAEGWTLALILAFALLTPLACLRLSPLRAAGVAVGAAVLYLVVSQIAFSAGTILALTYPLATLVLSAAIALAAQGSLTAVERARVRDVFARFVPPAVVDTVLRRTDDDLRLGGVSRESTVMFADLRGFTSFAEGREPEQVIQVLNRYLTEMTEAIMAHGGTLISFMGDGIMAVFGAPLEQSDHADRALSATREMIGPRLAGVNAWLRAEGICDGFRMGVGLNSGMVMAGNVGSEQRLEYTAIGDTTNTAARLEAATKGTAFQAYVSAPTVAALALAKGDLVEVGEIPVRGRIETVRVFGLKGSS